MPSRQSIVSGKLPSLILASASPRRRELLTAAGFEFELLPTSIDESRRRGESPRAYVARLAFEKAAAARTTALQQGGSLTGLPVLGADTTVIIKDKMLAKPSSPSDARRMLRLLSG